MIIRKSIEKNLIYIETEPENTSWGREKLLLRKGCSSFPDRVLTGSVT